MPAARRTNAWLLLLLLALTVVLGVLAALQYRWIAAVSKADEQRTRLVIDAAAHHFVEDFDHEIMRVVSAFQALPPDANATDLANHYDEWSRNAREPRLIAMIYVADMTDQGPVLQRLDRGTSRLVDTAWPPAFDEVRSRVTSAGPGRPPLPRGPLVLSIPAVVLPLRGPGPPPLPAAFNRARFGGPPFGGPPLDPDRPLPEGFPPPRAQDDSMRPMPLHPRFVIVQLDRGVFANVMFPDLTRRYFAPGGDDGLDVAVTAGPDIIYRSDPAWPRQDQHAELSVPMFMMRPPGAQPQSAAETWTLRVRRHGGPLAEAIESARRRNLAVSAGVLLVLMAAVTTLAVLARREERLRTRQLEFVAGVTHELNTPVAALTSAGQNLADGIVTESSQVARYGAMIVKESRRLTEMIAHVLEFAGLQSGRKLILVPVDAIHVIDEAVAQCRSMADEKNIEIETDVANDLPLVDGDEASLTRAVQNLVANAIRHGGEGRWVGIRAARESGEVLVTVEDRGAGIAARDLPHLFEPFYRGRGADSVRGSGLGLTIVKQIAMAHGGSVSVERRRERGAAITLHLPAGGASARAATPAEQHA